MQTAKTTTMVIMILCGATCFTGVFLGVGGGDVVTSFVLDLGFLQRVFRGDSIFGFTWGSCECKKFRWSNRL